MKILYDLLLMSISGSLMFILSSVAHRQMRQRFAQWYYALLVTSAAMFIVPLQALFTSHKLFKVIVPPVQTVISGGAAYNGTSFVASVFSPSAFIIILWAAVSLVLLCITAYRYFRIARSLKAVSEECYNEAVLEVFSRVCYDMRIHREIEVRTSVTLTSPLLFGVLRPVVIVPEKEFSQAELIMIFTHELTHYRHCDLAIKLMMSVVRCIHFFNPAVYFLSKAINEGCELCCDEAVLDRLNLQDKKAYGRLIISVIESENRAMAYSTAMASPKDKIQKRLLKIIEFRSPSRLLKMISVMLAASISLCSLTALGFEAAKEALPEEVTRTIASTLTGSAHSPFAQIIDALPEETAEPEITEKPEPASEPEHETAAPAEEPLQTIAEGSDTSAENNTAVKSYSFDLDYAAEEPAITAAPIKTIEMPGSSYVFNPSFAGGAAEIRSDNIYVTWDIFAAISRTEGRDSCILRIYRVNEYGEDDLIYDENTLNANGNNLNIRFLQGETYYMVAQQNNNAERASIYVSAR
ncbi:MAG: M56 family metallopeptidase [Candidatus Ornithomonoglobus sp.]